jgi:hypothetical protein
MIIFVVSGVDLNKYGSTDIILDLYWKRHHVLETEQTMTDERNAKLKDVNDKMMLMPDKKM